MLINVTIWNSLIQYFITENEDSPRKVKYINLIYNGVTGNKNTHSTGYSYKLHQLCISSGIFNESYNHIVQTLDGRTRLQFEKAYYNNEHSIPKWAFINFIKVRK